MLQGQHHTPETKEKIKQSMEEVWKDPVHKQNLCRASQESWNKSSPDRKLNQSILSKQLWSDPQWKQKTLNAQRLGGYSKEYWNGPLGKLHKEQKGQQSKQYWSSPEGKRIMRQMSTSKLQTMFYNFLVSRNPTKKLKQNYLITIPNKNLPLKFGTNKYFFFLDIVEPTNKVDIEVDGKMWHSSKQDKLRDLERDTILQELGWKVIRLPAKTVTDIICKKLECPKFW